MKTINRILLISIICPLIGILQPINLFAQQNSSTPGIKIQRDGQHSFDFHLGRWKSTIKRLLHPLTGSTTWIPMTGTLNMENLGWTRAN